MWDLFVGHKRSLTPLGANNRSFVSTLQNYFENFHSCSPLPDSGRGAGGGLAHGCSIGEGGKDLDRKNCRNLVLAS
jgi:hypothetical protein